MHWIVWPFYIMGFGFAIIGLIFGIRKQKAQNLANRFARIGRLDGLTYNEIVNYVGEPSEIECRIATNTKLPIKNVSWRAGGAEIRIMFNHNDVVDHIISETYNP